MRSLTRRQWIAGSLLLGASAVGANAFAIEPRRVSVTRHSVGSGGTGRARRIVQLSDLHLQDVGAHEDRVACAVAALAPDLVVMTGDSIDDAGHVDLLGEFLSLLDTGTQKVAILGNWEHWARVDLAHLARTYERHGCRLLRNETVLLHLDGRELLVSGLDDLVGGAPDLADTLRGVPPHPDHLVLAHCPAHRDLMQRELASMRADASDTTGASNTMGAMLPRCVLSGHTHGGQIALFGWAPVRPRGSGPYVAGWYDGEIPLYVSRGIGTTMIPARFGAPPEVALFEWTTAS